MFYYITFQSFRGFGFRQNRNAFKALFLIGLRGFWVKIGAKYGFFGLNY